MRNNECPFFMSAFCTQWYPLYSDQF